MKLKSHKGFSKRIRKTKSGKLQYRSASISHLRRKQSKARRRRHLGYKKVSQSNQKQVKRLVPY